MNQSAFRDSWANALTRRAVPEYKHPAAARRPYTRIAATSAERGRKWVMYQHPNNPCLLGSHAASFLDRTVRMRRRSGTFPLWDSSEGH